MNSYLREREIFETCLDLPSEARGEHLKSLCEGNELLRARVEALLEAHSRASVKESGDPFLRAAEEGARDTSSKGSHSFEGEPSEDAIDGQKPFCSTCQALIPDFDTAACEQCGRKRPIVGWPTDPWVGRKVAGGQYRVLRRLGSGGFGVVYEVETIVGGLKRALKVLMEHWVMDEKIRQRFINEALVLEQINHPNVARCFSAGVMDDGAGLYLLFELIDGRPLSHLIRDEERGTRPLEPLRAVRIAKQVASGLMAAHAKQILHRDLKPANILVLGEETSTEQAKLLDFGVAKLLEVDVTSSGQLLGTPAFMAPEQIKPGLPMGVGIDLWQLGATLFAMLTGVPPYAEKGDSFEEIMDRFRAQGEPGPTPSEVNPEIGSHPGLNRLVSRLLATDPADRPESAAEVCEELARIDQAMSPTVASSRPALLEALAAQPSRSSWSALCRYLANQDTEVRQMAEERLSDWPAGLRLATVQWWEQARQGSEHPLWSLVRSLDLSFRGLTDEDLIRLSKLSALSSLRKLNLEGNEIGPEGIAALASSPFIAGLEHLELRGNALGVEGVSSLVRSPHLKRLRYLGLSGNRVGADGLDAIVRSDLRLKGLDISKNDLRTAGAEILAQSPSPYLEVLNLRGNLMGPDGVAILAVSPVLSNLRDLELSDNTLGPGGAAALAVSKAMGNIRRLALAQNNIGRQGLQLLLSSSGLERLESLDVSSNGLGANGAMFLASSPVARRLRHLDLADNQIEDAGLAGLLGSPQLTGLLSLGVAQNSLTASGVGLLDGAGLQVDILDLSDNEIGELGAAQLASAISQLRVRNLSIRRTGLSGEDVASIVKGSRKGIEILDVSQNELQTEGIETLARVAELDSLRHLTLDGAWSGPAGMKPLVSSPFLVDLEKLHINSTAIGDKGIAELLTGTGLNSLQELQAQDNGIGPEGAAALAASPIAARLKCLDLSFNRLGDAGAEALARGPVWQQLQELRLRDNEISFGGATALLASPGLEMLQILDVSANPLRGQLDVHSLADDKIALMEDSFAKISSDGKRFAEHFYGELFSRYPGVKPLFANTTMGRQQQHLFSSLVMVIENLRRPDAVADSLAALGKRHVGYGVSPTHYYAVTSTLLDTIKAMLGNEWNEAIQEAWTDGLEAVSRTMMQAHRTDRSEKQHQVSGDVAEQR